MKICPFCTTQNDDVYTFCRQCGQQLNSLVLSSDEPAVAGASTILLQGQTSVRPRRSVPLATLFARQRELIVGRAPDCDICLQHPSVSRYHALFVRLPEGVQVSDLGSINGVRVDGRRIHTPQFVREKQVVGIGPFLFTLVGDTLESLDSRRGLRLEARSVEKVVEGFDGLPKKLLDNINLVVQPGEFVSLLGPSGSGKSTLMDCLNGRRRATGGQVLANGEDFYQHFDNFRQLLGYVPQKDIVHTGLTVHRALYYTARLRLPTDTDRTELDSRVEDVLREMELLPHRDTLIGNLSGGQIKRVSLGAELLARPCMLYIDEATSGLDAGTESRMMRLFRQLSDEGRSIVCITHNVENVEQCHLVLILARGRLLFVGPPAEAPPHFGVTRLSEIYDSIQARTPEEWEKRFSESSHFADHVASRLARGTRSSHPGSDGSAQPPQVQLIDTPESPPPSKRPLLADKIRGLLSAAGGRAFEMVRPVSEQWHQLKVLTRRYARLVLNDPRSLRLLFLQAPVVALFLLIGFVNKPYQQQIPATRRLSEMELAALQSLKDLSNEHPEWNKLTPEQRRILEHIPVPKSDGTGTQSLAEALSSVEGLNHQRLLDYLLSNEEPLVPYQLIDNPAYTYLLLSIVVIAVLWFGCNNAAKEIVKEEAIYNRERAVNLRIAPYLGSKFIVLAVISAVQTLLFMVVLYGVLEGLHYFFKFDAPLDCYRLDYVSQFGVLFLLSLSGVALGLLLSSCVSSPDRANALLPYVLIPQMILGGGVIIIREGFIYWLAVVFSPVYWAFRGVRRGATELPADMYYHMNYDDSLWIACGALGSQTFVLLLLTAWFLKSKDAA
jgi:ABC-type multidrug transport system ATPase subunit